MLRIGPVPPTSRRSFRSRLTLLSRRQGSKALVIDCWHVRSLRTRREGKGLSGQRILVNHDARQNKTLCLKLFLLPFGFFLCFFLFSLVLLFDHNIVLLDSIILIQPACHCVRMLTLMNWNSISLLYSIVPMTKASSRMCVDLLASHAFLAPAIRCLGRLGVHGPVTTAQQYTTVFAVKIR